MVPASALLLSLAAEGGIFLVVALLAIGAPLVLWYLVRAEAEATETMDRTNAERAARKDGEKADEENR